MIQLPWDKKTVPHCVIEITGRCNMSCRACYREKQETTKPVEDILEEVKLIERTQTVHTISLAGGEPTLHPQLCEIVQRIKSRNHKVSLVTNGLLLDHEMLQNLKHAGVDIIMIHVDEGQNRPDLPEEPTITDINSLRKAIAEKVAGHGMDAGLCVTIYDDSFANTADLVQCIFDSRHINFLFATHAVRIPNVVDKIGSKQLFREAPTRNSHVMNLMKEKFELDCYAYIPPRDEDEELPCISYFIPVVHGKNKNAYYKIMSCWIDRSLIVFSKIVNGRYMYYCKHNSLIIATQLLFNGIFQLRILQPILFLVQSMLPGRLLRAKRLVFENAPVITANGEVNCCDFCPNSTVRNGKVVPVCLADHLS